MGIFKRNVKAEKAGAATVVGAELAAVSLQPQHDDNSRSSY
jgi:hypothetical protein